MKTATRKWLIAAAAAGILLTSVDMLRLARVRAFVGAGLGSLPAATDLTARRDERILREADPTQAKLRLSRAIVAAALDPSSVTTSPAGDEEIRQQLRMAHQIAQEDLARRPTSWQAAMLLGASTYLLLVRERDTRLFTDAADWEEPLMLARRLAPGQSEPQRFLAAAYLDTWSALSDKKRQLATQLLETVFQDPASFRLLAGKWLDVEQDLRVALTRVPDDKSAWRHLELYFTRLRAWEPLVIVRERWRRAVVRSAAEELQRAASELQGGDIEGGSITIARVLHGLPPGTDTAPVLERGLGLLPPGRTTISVERTLAEWLDWAMEVCVFTECPLHGAVMNRLATLGHQSRPPERALGALASGDRVTAERLERSAQSNWTEAWLPYLLFKAKWLSRQGALAEASSTLRQVPGAWRDRPIFWQIQSDVALSQGDAGGEELATRRLRAFASDSWPFDKWQRDRGLSTLELVPARAASGLELTLVSDPAVGGTADISWNGQVMTEVAVFDPVTIELAVDVTPQVHWLKVRTLRGASVRPQSTALAP